MSPSSRSAQFKFLPFTLTLVIAGIALLISIVIRHDPSFPNLPIGAYTGTVTGVTLGKTETFSLYVERLERSSSLLIVAFVDGWLPQTVTLKAREGQGADKPGDRLFEPVRVEWQGTEFVFSGLDRRGEFIGEVTESGRNSRGRWELRPVDSSLMKRRFDLRPPDDLLKWLQARANAVAVSAEHEQLNEGIRAATDKIQSLNRFVNQEDMLRERAKQRREVLFSEVTKMRTEREKYDKEIGDLVGELALQTRISKLGKAVALARNIANREKNWYFANWGVEEDPAAVEEMLADKANVNLGSLNTAFRKAREVQVLKQEATREREKIQQLREQMMRPPSEPPPVPEPPMATNPPARGEPVTPRPLPPAAKIEGDGDDARARMDRDPEPEEVEKSWLETLF